MAYPFRGERIILRPFEPGDYSALREYLNHPDLAGCRYIPHRFPEMAPLSPKQVEDICAQWAGEKTEYHFAVVQRETQTLIGHAEVDWGWDSHCPGLALVIAPAHRRQGCGSEVLDLLLRYLFEHTPAHNVSVWFADWNEPARRFVKRHGFTESGGLRRAGLREGRYFGVVCADILRPEWRARVKGAAHAA
jgi:RimJ/RimL family protein N-acetyltransferase